ncbi:MAG: tail fiber domain-containing protein [Thermoanaerobaculia bacterium]
MNTAGNNPNGIAGVRIAATDNNFSGDLVISTKTPGNGGNGTLAERLRVTNTGIVRINVPAATPVGAFLDVNGFVRVNLATGVSGETQVCRNATSGLLTNCSASSFRYKDAIETYTGSVNVLRQLRPVTFRWKADGGRDFGFIAEEVARVEPLLSEHDEHGGVNGVRYDHLGVLLVNAVKEEALDLDNERARADRLQRENEELRARLDRLEHVVERLVQK